MLLHWRQLEFSFMEYFKQLQEQLFQLRLLSVCVKPLLQPLLLQHSSNILSRLLPITHSFYAGQLLFLRLIF